jgi:para-aminobenzoate synthetase component 1
MRPFIQQVATARTPEMLVQQLRGEPGVVLLRSSLFESVQARYSFVTARAFLSFKSFGSRCEIRTSSEGAPVTRVQFGDPWHLLDSLMARYEMLDELDLPFPLGGCFGYWGYDLKNFVEPKLARRAGNDLDLPDCQVGFYGSLVVFDHRLGSTWIVSTGMEADGSRSEKLGREQAAFWQECMAGERTQGAVAGSEDSPSPQPSPPRRGRGRTSGQHGQTMMPPVPRRGGEWAISANLTRSEFLAHVTRAQEYIRAGDIYQVNLSQRLESAFPFTGWNLYQRLSSVSPSPFSAFLDCGDFQIASSSPELFLRLSGPHIQTRPIKGTRPRSSEPTRDAQLTYELQTSAKEMAELVMITDLLRNDLGKVCEFGSVQVPDLVRLERYPQVQHLVSTIEGRLRPGTTHFAAFASCFPGGSITGAPKFRAMEIIEELEPTSRGPYTGALGYLGFNRESQLSILIRAAICKDKRAYFNVGAGIVADSVPAAEYDETLAKARGFLEALRIYDRVSQRKICS